jgi:hypothetical protein
MNSITAKADYSEAAGHVLDVVHEVQIKRYNRYVLTQTLSFMYISMRYKLKDIIDLS